MSTLKVEVCKIEVVEKHPNADRLDIVTIKGWQCVTQRDSFKNGDLCVYLPIDCILPHSLEKILFPPDSKVRLHNSRIKTIKLRGAISQGMVVHPETIGLQKIKLGQDLTTQLEIKKYEPPTRGINLAGKQKRTKQHNPNFYKYTEIENFKNYTDVFELGEEVVVTEKIHGTNFRCGWVKFHADTIWKKIKKFFGFTSEYEFVYGSHNVQLHNSLFYNGAYSSDQGNVYAQIVKKYQLDKILVHDEVLYGEIYGHGIQKNYSYGLPEGELKLAVFDVMVKNIYLSYKVMTTFLCESSLPEAPVLYNGPFNIEAIKILMKVPSSLDKETIMEGVVIKPIKEEKTYMGRKILKLINDEYLLLKDNSEFH